MSRLARRVKHGIASQTEEDAFGDTVMRLCGQAFNRSGLPEHIRDDVTSAAVYKVLWELWRYDTTKGDFEPWCFGIAANWYSTEKHKCAMRYKSMEAAAELAEDYPHYAPDIYSIDDYSKPPQQQQLELGI